MSDAKPLQRALRILQRLDTFDNITINELHELFEKKVSKRTIQRTFQVFEDANIPVDIKTGPHGIHYYSLYRPFDFTPLSINIDEILAAVLLAPFADMFAGTRIGKDIESMLEKMDRLVPKDSISVASAMRGISDSIHIHQPGVINVDSRGSCLKDIMRAILEKRVCSVEYKKGPKAKVSRFEYYPYSILFHSGAIYVIGLQPYYKTLIYLAVQRIQSIDLTDDTFERDPNYDLLDFMKDKFGIWHEDPVDVVIRFDKTVAQSIEERTWHPSQKIKKSRKGDLELTLHVGPSEEMIAWILRWGFHAEVIQPESLRETVKELLEQTLQKYS